MKTTHQYKIDDFVKLDEPVFMNGCERPMIYKGNVTNKKNESMLVYWDESGKCAAEAWNDYFIHPYSLIKYLNNTILCLSKQ